MPAPAAIQKATLDKYIEGWKAWTPEKSLETWSDDVTFKTLPFSAGKPIRTRQQLEPRYVMLIENLTNFQLDIHNVVHDAEQSKAAIYATMKADTGFGEPYINEQATFIWFDESGEKVTKIEEMNDTAFRRDWEPKYYVHIGWGQPPKPATQ